MLADILNLIGEFAGGKNYEIDGVECYRLRFNVELHIIYEVNYTTYLDNEFEEYEPWGYRVISYEEALEEFIDSWSLSF